ncbi:23S rRNA (uracil(1939)-C(5))-methyltransferase RlmD [uncultured Ellagibacter sp.]|uniref:23S rRNA (uracil(1939)-C(5))-methyltransferase RlmD n=1 Tax=uncultured Ellagibacter sp. TaxID=2137580 RepID=UPI00261260A9|nr:23S rRNA (uracil(1939)-C(5))-methyltransferase RlmD [uncultured Ellagibacter sp.]
MSDMANHEKRRQEDAKKKAKSNTRVKSGAGSKNAGCPRAQASTGKPGGRSRDDSGLRNQADSKDRGGAASKGSQRQHSKVRTDARAASLCATARRAGASDSPCLVDARCGGCKNLCVPYTKQLIDKQLRIERLFAPLAPDGAISLIKGMKDPYHYRNKVISPFAPGKKLPPRGQDRKATDPRDRKAADARSAKGGKGKRPQARYEILTGMYVAGSHELVPTDKCLIENETAKKVVLAVRDIMRKHDVAPYREDTGTGFMRHVVVRIGHTSGEVLVTLVTNSDDFPSSKSFCRELIRLCPAVTTVVQNVNERQTNVILGDKERVLYGPGFILDELCGLSFRISSKSFYQVNATQTEVLYRTAMELADFDGTQVAIDAYCGTGTIGLVAAKSGAARVIGVDSVESAVRDARTNARHNGVENAEFVAADATDFMCELAKEGVLGAESTEEGARAGGLVVLMDPPRAGSTEEFLRAAAALAPERIVYISCNPETQARDVEFLDSLGYAVVAVQPVDMFPHTDHIECIVALEPADSLSPDRWGKEGGEEVDVKNCDGGAADETSAEEVPTGEAPAADPADAAIDEEVE